MTHGIKTASTEAERQSEIKIDVFTHAYIECALWSTNDESTPQGGEPLDDNYGPENLAPECLAAMIADCKRFQAENAEDLLDANYNHATHSDDEMGGHDFWLTRNGHGSGFWDGELGDIGDRLTEASETFGGVCLIVGDAGKIHCS